LLLALASAVILESEYRGTHTHILLSQVRDSPNLEGQVPVFITPGTGWRSYTPGTEFDPYQYNYSCMNAWVPAISRGENRKLCSKSLDKAYIDLKLS
jgi:hypothetical protein